MNKEYLETTFPDGTPVKIYPAKGAREMLKMSNEEAAMKLPSTPFEIKQFMIEYLGSVTEYIDKAKDLLNDKSIQQSILSASNQMD